MFSLSIISIKKVEAIQLNVNEVIIEVTFSDVHKNCRITLN